jgi:hypothetical protein
MSAGEGYTEVAEMANEAVAPIVGELYRRPLVEVDDRDRLAIERALL